MTNQNLFEKIWYDVRDYIVYLLSDAIKLILTIGVLNVILFITDIVFTERLKIIDYTEIASYIGILLIFVIDTFSNIYLHYKNRLKKIKSEGDLH